MDPKIAALAADLEKGISGVGSAWFDVVNKKVEEFTYPDGFADLGGAAAFAIASWGLMNVLASADKDSALTKPQRGELAAQLSVRLYGDQKAEGWAQIEKWVRLPNGDMVFNFASTIAEYVTGDDHPLEAAVIISTLVPDLAAANSNVAQLLFRLHGFKRKRWWFF